MHSETAGLNRERLAELYMELGQSGAEGVVCRAMEELSERLHRIGGECEPMNFNTIEKTARSMVGIADQIGMYSLANVAGHVQDAARQKNHAAVGGTVARLLRIGENSLTAIWDLQEMPL